MTTSSRLREIRKPARRPGARGRAHGRDGFEKGGAGATALAETVAEAARHPSAFEPVYELDAPIAAKIEAIATRVYGADGIELLPAAQTAIAHYEKLRLGGLPICMAKTHLSLAQDPKLKNAPTGFTVPIRDIRP